MRPLLRGGKSKARCAGSIMMRLIHKCVSLMMAQTYGDTAYTRRRADMTSILSSSTQLWVCAIILASQSSLPPSLRVRVQQQPCQHTQ